MRSWYQACLSQKSNLRFSLRKESSPHLTHKMNVILFGVNGAIGRSLLKECLLDPDVSFVKTIGPTSIDIRDRKLIQFQNLDMWNYKHIKSELKPFDVCIYCSGVSSLGMTEERYNHITYNQAVTVAAELAHLNPNMTFIYVSIAGADTSETGRNMWARIKGKTENAILAMPFKAAFMIRPTRSQVFQSMETITLPSHLFKLLSKPMVHFFDYLFQKRRATNEALGQNILRVAKLGAPKAILEMGDIANL